MFEFFLKEGDNILYAISLILTGAQQSGLIPPTYAPLVTAGLGLLHTVVVPQQPSAPK